MSEAKKSKVVRVHRQAIAMYADVRRHLAVRPEDGILFLLDYERALNELGFTLSKGMRAHLSKQFPGTSEYKKECYRRIKGGAQPPFSITLSLGEFDNNGLAADRIGSTPVQGESIVSQAVPKVAHVGTFKDASMASGFSVLIQLSDNIINRALKAAYDASLFPRHWEGKLIHKWPQIQVDTTCSYSLDLSLPTVDFDTAYYDGVAVNLELKGSISLDFNILKLSNPTDSEYQKALTIQVDCSVRGVGTAKVTPFGGSKSAVSLDLKEVRDLKITLTNAFPENLSDYLSQLLRRIIRTKFKETGPTPMTFGFDNAQRSGIPIRAIGTRIRPPANGLPGTLAIALDTTGNGDATVIPHIIPSGNHYAIVITREFLIGQVWPAVGKPQFPFDAGDGVTVYNPNLDMQEGYIWFEVDAKKDITCLPSIHAHASVRLGFQSFLDGKIYRTRLLPLQKPDVELNFWDELFYVFVGGLLGSAVGLGEVAVVVLIVLVRILEDKLGTDAGEKIRGFSVGFEEKIPGTDIIIAASTPVQPQIHYDRIFGFGDAVFYQAPRLSEGS
jgi:hypothetical protein